MDRLDLRKDFKGTWDTAVFLSYSFDPIAFERLIWPSIGDSCRTTIVLCDGAQYAKTCEAQAKAPELVRHLNVRYACGGVESQHAFHPKAAILLSADSGRLFVGSGNLSWQGFASGGEVFTRFDWQAETSDEGGRARFVRVRELIEALFDDGQAPGYLREFVRSAWDGHPWLLQDAPEAVGLPAVVHNTSSSMLAQLTEIVAGEHVDELHVLSPFHDEDCSALRALMTQLSPGAVKVYLQEGRASVDPAALARVAESYSGDCRFIPCTSEAKKTAYLHAKVYLVRTTSRDICLTGSPNCSDVAMLRSGLGGNTELATVLQAPLGEMDYLLEGLRLGESTTDPGTLHVELAEDDDDRVEMREPRVIGACLAHGVLTLDFDALWPGLRVLEVRLAGTMLEIASSVWDGRSLECLLSGNGPKVDRPALLSVSLLNGGEPMAEQSVFVCHLDALKAQAGRASAVPKETFAEFGDLALGDREARRLLAGWLAELLIDARSLKELAGHRSSADVFDDAPVELSWDVIDFDAYRRHPRVRQYLPDAVRGHGDPDSPLDIMLAEVQRTFLGLAGLDVPAPLIAPAVEPEYGAEPEPETEDEAQERAEERAVDTARDARALQHAATRFITRCLRGFASERFRQEVGAWVIAKNYVLFQHFLTLCFRKSWIDAELAAHASADLWAAVWGADSRVGWIDGLTGSDREGVLAFLRREYADAEFVGLLLNCDHVARDREDTSLLESLQAVWRRILVERPMPLDDELFDYAWVYAADLLPERSSLTARLMVERLSALAEWVSEESITSRLAQAAGPELTGHFGFEEITRSVRGVKREMRERQLQLDCPTGYGVDRDVAVRVFAEWMRLEECDYYRVEWLDESGTKIAVAVYTPQEADRFLYIWSVREHSELGVIERAARPWDLGLGNVLEARPQLDLAVRGPRPH